MVICEKRTNIKQICYSGLGAMPFPLVRFKAVADYFFSEDSIVITDDENNVFETRKIFQYDADRANENSVSFSIYEFVNNSIREYIIRIVKWDKNKAKEQISKTPNEAEMELNSEIYYIDSVASSKVQILIQKIRDYFEIELKFDKTATLNLQSKVYIDFDGFSKTIQWGAPFASEEMEDFLGKTVEKINVIVSEINGGSIFKADVLFAINPYEYERIIF